MTDYSYIGVGKLYARVKDAAAPLAFVGNASALRVSITEATKALKDYTNAGGGNYNELRRIESMQFSMTVHDLSAANFARAVFGNSAAITAGTVTDEALTVYVGGITPTAYPIDTAVAPVVTHTSGSPTYTVGTDYEVSAGGISIPTGSAITDGQSIKVDYTKDAGNSIQALLNSAQEYEFFFDGLNDARSGKAVLVHLFRVKLGATDGLDLIGEDYYAGTQAGEVLKDTSKNGTTVSQYFKATIVD